MARAVYPGTFDPLTSGHHDLVMRAARLFDTVIVGVAASRGKNPLFTPEERLAIAREALAGFANVEVVPFAGLLVDFAKMHQAPVVVRGIRAVSDFDYEFQLAGMNRRLAPGFETVFMTPADDFQFVSATLVREIALLGGDVAAFVPPTVLGWIERKRAELGRARPAAGAPSA